MTKKKNEVSARGAQAPLHALARARFRQGRSAKLERAIILAEIAASSAAEKAAAAAEAWRVAEREKRSAEAKVVRELMRRLKQINKELHRARRTPRAKRYKRQIKETEKHLSIAVRKLGVDSILLEPEGAVDYLGMSEHWDDLMQAEGQPWSA